MRSTSAVAGVATATVLALATAAGPATADGRPPRAGWTGAWASSMHHPVPGNEWDGPNWSQEGFARQSVRQVVRVAAGGSRVRIRLSNRYGTTALRLAGASIARSGEGAAVRAGTVRPLTFGGRAAASIPTGAELVSDPAAMVTTALDQLTVTLYFAGDTGPATFHEGGLTVSYRADGDHRFDVAGTAFAGTTSDSRYYLTGVDVAGRPRSGPPAPAGAVVAFGDSITDGYGTTAGADNRYPDQLAERLVADGGRVSVLNAGINGNKLLADSPCYGERGVTRFQRDVLAQPGVRVAVVLAGINDIGAGGFPDFGCGSSPVVNATALIEGFRAIVRAARAHGVAVVGVTIAPMKGAAGYDTPANEAVRTAVNHWIRIGGAFHTVVDLDHVLADPRDPRALRAAFDSGDHLHLNDAGADALAHAVSHAIGHGADRSR
jgi:lysophospholipase L1-like esterase